MNTEADLFVFNDQQSKWEFLGTGNVSCSYKQDYGGFCLVVENGHTQLVCSVIMPDALFEKECTKTFALFWLDTKRFMSLQFYTAEGFEHIWGKIDALLLVQQRVGELTDEAVQPKVAKGEKKRKKAKTKLHKRKKQEKREIQADAEQKPANKKTRDTSDNSRRKSSKGKSQKSTTKRQPKESQKKPKSAIEPECALDAPQPSAENVTVTAERFSPRGAAAIDSAPSTVEIVNTIDSKPELFAVEHTLEPTSLNNSQPFTDPLLSLATETKQIPNSPPGAGTPREKSTPSHSSLNTSLQPLPDPPQSPSEKLLAKAEVDAIRKIQGSGAISVGSPEGQHNTPPRLRSTKDQQHIKDDHSKVEPPISQSGQFDFRSILKRTVTPSQKPQPDGTSGSTIDFRSVLRRRGQSDGSPLCSSSSLPASSSSGTQVQRTSNARTGSNAENGRKRDKDKHNNLEKGERSKHKEADEETANTNDVPTKGDHDLNRDKAGKEQEKAKDRERDKDREKAQNKEKLDKAGLDPPSERRLANKQPNSSGKKNGDTTTKEERDEKVHSLQLPSPRDIPRLPAERKTYSSRSMHSEVEVKKGLERREEKNNRSTPRAKRSRAEIDSMSTDMSDISTPRKVDDSKRSLVESQNESSATRRSLPSGSLRQRDRNHEGRTKELRYDGVSTDDETLLHQLQALQKKYAKAKQHIKEIKARERQKEKEKAKLEEFIVTLTRNLDKLTKDLNINMEDNRQANK